MSESSVPWHSGDPCPNCGKETDTDKCGPLYCPACNWQQLPCEHQETIVAIHSDIGTPTEQRTCGTCGGSGRRNRLLFSSTKECWRCHGEGTLVAVRCHHCNGSGWREMFDLDRMLSEQCDCDDGILLIPASQCITCPDCEGRQVMAGEGQEWAYPCPRCKGTEWVKDD